METSADNTKAILTNQIVEQKCVGLRIPLLAARLKVYEGYFLCNRVCKILRESQREKERERERETEGGRWVTSREKEFTLEFEVLSLSMKFQTSSSRIRLFTSILVGRIYITYIHNVRQH